MKRQEGPLLPGSTIGILGGGQLGRFLSVEARRMGYRSIVLDPAEKGPAAQVCDEHLKASLNDARAAATLASRCDVVTMEWELIPFEVLSAVPRAKLFPNAEALRRIQDRLVQRQFLEKAGLPQTAWRPVSSIEELRAAAAELGFPCYLKARRAGYDGKGQARIVSEEGLDQAWKSLDGRPSILEAEVPHKRELSVILARGKDGSVSFFPLAENTHRNGILHTTVAPAPAPAALAAAAKDLGNRAAEALGQVGVLTAELFQTAKGALLINELAPRVHNSGHFTLDACVTSQFEQHLRAVLGLPLGDPAQTVPAVMVNLLGDLWDKGEPRWETVLARPGAKLYLYGKAEARTGRKMGHVTFLGKTPKTYLKDADLLLKELKA